MPPIKAASKTKDTSSNGNTNLLSSISPNSSVEEPDVIVTSPPKPLINIYENRRKIDQAIAAPNFLFLSLSSSAFLPRGARVIIIPNKKRTITAPI